MKNPFDGVEMVIRIYIRSHSCSPVSVQSQNGPPHNYNHPFLRSSCFLLMYDPLLAIVLLLASYAVDLQGPMSDNVDY